LIICKLGLQQKHQEMTISCQQCHLTSRLFWGRCF